MKYSTRKELRTIKMINTLISDIRNYILYLEENNIYISIHTDFTEYMLPLLEFNIHKNPKCLLVKSDNSRWDKCIKLHNSEFYGEKKSETRVCHAGVKETVFFLCGGGNVCASTNEKINETTLGILINPLCRMIEYLKSICPETKEEITDNESVNRAVKFIQRNFYNQISNNDIAKVCSCSVSTLCHLFKKFKGISVHQYISDLRFDYAKQLLAVSRLSVTAIAHKSGFSDYNYFTVKFKKKTGLSPSEYRKNASKKGAHTVRN